MYKRHTWRIPPLNDNAGWTEIWWYGHSHFPPSSADVFRTLPKRYFRLCKREIKKAFKAA